MRLKTLATLGLAAVLLLPGVSPAAEYTLKFGTLAPDDTPWSAILKDFQKIVEGKSGDRVEVKTYLGGALGDERAMLQKMRFGQLTGGGFSTGGISTVVPVLQVLEIPYLFENVEEADYILDTVMLEDFRKALEEKGLFLFCWAENGWLDFGNKVHAIKKPRDLAGIKMFMQESDTQEVLYAALGAQAVPLPVTDVLNSLQTGLVEGVSSTPVFGAGAFWTSQLKYWTDSNHMYQPAAVVFDLKFWNKLPGDIQKIILAERDGLQVKARKDVRGIDDDMLKSFEENGIEIYHQTAAEREAFQEKTADCGDKLVEKGVVPKETLEKIRKALKEYRAGKK